mgnify:CR=1 FL=1
MREFIIHKKELLLSFLPYLFVLFSSLYFPKDPDLGWHLRYGQYFINHGQVLRENIFSSMMPGYQWANGSWGTDVLTYALFSLGGFLALSIAGAMIVTLTFFFFSKAARLSIFQELFFFPVFVYLLYPINSSSFRGQQVSLLFLGILFFLLSKYRNHPKIIFSIPFLFLFWANMHEESFLGLALFAVWALGILIVTTFKKNVTQVAISLVGAFLITFINPFGYGIHQVALSHLNDPLLGKINEYIPFLALTRTWWNELIVIAFSFFVIVLSISKKTVFKNLPVVLGIFLMLCMSLAVKRYAWPFYYMVFLLVPMLSVSSFKISKEILKAGAILVFIISFSYVYVNNNYLRLESTWDTYCRMQEVPCSQKAGKYLVDHKLGKNLFTSYDWGGWLIWNFPTVRPSIDGRMHLWRDKNGYSAIEDYVQYVESKKKIDQSPYNVVLMPLDRSPLYDELSALIVKGSWELVYVDNEAGIVVRKPQ